MMFVLLVVPYQGHATPEADSQPTEQSSISLEALVTVMAEGSLEAAIARSQQYAKTKANKTAVAISNGLKQMGSGQSVAGHWQLRSLKNGGIEIFLSTAPYYLDPAPVFERPLVACADNSASSATDYLNFDNNTQLVYEHSCGSAGCSYRYLLRPQQKVC